MTTKSTVKLTREKADLIHRWLATGYTYQAIAKKLGIGNYTLTCWLRRIIKWEIN